MQVQHVERRKQGRGAIALVVVRHGAGSSLFHGQAGLGAVERLNPALFIDAEDQRFIRRIEIEPDHILARDLERLAKMRLQPVRSQIRWTLLKEMPATAAMLRPLKWLAFGGFACSVSAVKVSTFLTIWELLPVLAVSWRCRRSAARSRSSKTVLRLRSKRQ